MSDTAIRIYVLFLCVNAVLILGGFTVASSNDIIYTNYTQADATDSTGWSNFLSMLNNLIGFFTGEGIVGLLTSAGLPSEIQIIIGAPFVALGILALAPLISAGAGAVSNLVRWFI